MDIQVGDALSDQLHVQPGGGLGHHLDPGWLAALHAVHVDRYHEEAIGPRKRGLVPKAAIPRVGNLTAQGPDRSVHESTERRLWEIFAAAAAIFLLLEWVIGRIARWA